MPPVDALGRPRRLPLVGVHPLHDGVGEVAPFLAGTAVFVGFAPLERLAQQVILPARRLHHVGFFVGVGLGGGVFSTVPGSLFGRGFFPVNSSGIPNSCPLFVRLAVFVPAYVFAISASMRRFSILSLRTAARIQRLG
jgi:hypothetical protein